MKKIILLLLFLNSLLSIGQISFYQDIFKGGICVIGTSSANGTGTVDLPYYIESGSTLRKVFLITYTQTNGLFYPDDFDVLVNGQPFNQNDSNNTLVFSPNITNLSTYTGHRAHISDITSQLTLSGGVVEITMNIQNIPNSANCPACLYAAPVLVVLYENSSLSTINVLLAINNELNTYASSNLLINDFNAVDMSEDIAMGIHSDRVGGDVNDGYEYYINGQYVGLNNQPDALSIGSGAVGAFYYQNNTLIGLTDDVANNALSGSDAIILLNDYVPNNLNPMNIKYSYTPPISYIHNILVGLYFAYTTPCEPFDIFVSSDTTICQGSQLQLTASGGQGYEWQPAIGLSCTTCPNPVLTADSTRLYTVKIFNNDSCSVIRPVMVHVKEKPVIESISIQPTICGDSTGIVTVNPTVGLTYSLNNGNWQSEESFSSLWEGNHLIQIKDTFGCQNDTLIYVENVNQTQANFSVTPNIGAAPLDVVVINQSTNVTDFSWLVNGQFYNGDLSNYTFDTSGVYQITLIAYNNIPSCADTFSVNVVVNDNMVVTIPNVFTPNGDGINDFYSITSNQNTDYEFVIINRWGNILIDRKGKLSASIPKIIWDGANASDGVYFIQLFITNPATGKKMELQEFITIKH